MGIGYPLLITTNGADLTYLCGSMKGYSLYRIEYNINIEWNVNAAICIQENDLIYSGITKYYK